MKQMSSTSPGGTADVMANMKMLLKGTIELKVITWLDPASGRNFKLDAEAKMNQTVEVVDFGMSVPMTGTMTSSMVLQQ